MDVIGRERNAYCRFLVSFQQIVTNVLLYLLFRLPKYCSFDVRDVAASHCRDVVVHADVVRG